MTNCSNSCYKIYSVSFWKASHRKYTRYLTQRAFIFWTRNSSRREASSGRRSWSIWWRACGLRVKMGLCSFTWSISPTATGGGGGHFFFFLLVYYGDRFSKYIPFYCLLPAGGRLGALTISHGCSWVSSPGFSLSRSAVEPAELARLRPVEEPRR